MEPLYYTNAHNDYFKSVSKRLKVTKDKDRKHVSSSSITSFSLPNNFKEANILYSGNENYSYKSNYKKSHGPSNPYQGLSPISIHSPIQLPVNSKVLPNILVSTQEYKARNKNELSVSANEHLKLLSRKGNGLVLVKAIGRLSGTGLVPTSVVRVADLENRPGHELRLKYDQDWLNSPDYTNSYEKAKLEETAKPEYHSNFQSYHTYDQNTPKRTGSFSVSKPTPIKYGMSTPEQDYNYESKAQYSKESTDTVNSFEKDLKRSDSCSTIGSSVSSIRSLNYRKSLSNNSSPALSEMGIENDINYSVDAEDEDSDLTGFDKELCVSPIGNQLFDIDSVAVSNVYSNNGRYWYKAEIFYRNGNKRYLRRFYQDFHDLHMNITTYINDFQGYVESETAPKIPGPIPRPDPNNPSKALLQRCQDLNVYLKTLFAKLLKDGYQNDIFDEWISPRYGDYDMNNSDPVAASLDNSIIFERPILGSEPPAQEQPEEGQRRGLGSPKLCTPGSEQSFITNNEEAFQNNGFNSLPMLRPRSPPMSQSANSLHQVMNKNLPPIPMKDSLYPPTPVSIRRNQLHTPAHPTPISIPGTSPFNQFDDEDDEKVDKSNNDIMEEIESELNMKNVSIVSGQPQNANGGLDFSQHQISGPQIRVKVFYNDGEDIFMCKYPVSVNLSQLNHKIFARIQDDYAKRKRRLNTKCIFLFSKDSNGMYTALKDDIGLRGVIRTAKGKFSVRVEFD